jgi:hypothetical protein
VEEEEEGEEEGEEEEEEEMRGFSIGGVLVMKHSLASSCRPSAARPRASLRPRWISGGKDTPPPAPPVPLGSAVLASA